MHMMAGQSAPGAGRSGRAQQVKPGQRLRQALPQIRRGMVSAGFVNNELRPKGASACKYSDKVPGRPCCSSITTVSKPFCPRIAATFMAVVEVPTLPLLPIKLSTVPGTKDALSWGGSCRFWRLNEEGLVTGTVRQVQVQQDELRWALSDSKQPHV